MPIPWSIACLGERSSTPPRGSNLAGLGADEAAEDVHERRLAGAVLAEKGVHLAGPELEVDAVVRTNSWELLHDAAELDER